MRTETAISELPVPPEPDVVRAALVRFAPSMPAGKSEEAVAGGADAAVRKLDHG